MNKEKYWLYAFFAFLKSRFDLDGDNAQEREVTESIAKGVEFKGTNTWILMFAIFIASLGLNVNSAAVIIGAMLISPLMGPIIGIGLSLGINDFDLMKRSLRNFGLMVLISMLTSTFYFLISPLSNAQSELLARTVPTIYDVLIAFFGGLAGIVAQTRRDRTSTVVPGVAIATALMPPLCTAGYGLATGQFTYFLGAFYLFFINTVFIAIAAFIMVRFLKYEKKQFVDKSRETRVRRSMYMIVFITLVPSVVIAYRIIQRTIFENNADKYVSSVFNFNNTLVLNYERQYKNDGKGSFIDMMLVGEPLTDDVLENVRAQMPSYGLNDTELIVRQSGGGGYDGRADVSNLSKSFSQLLEEKNAEIARMKEELAGFRSETFDFKDIAREAGAVVDNVRAVLISRPTPYDTAGKPGDVVLVCIVKPVDPGLPVDTDRLSEWLKVRTDSGAVKIYVE